MLSKYDLKLGIIFFVFLMISCTKDTDDDCDITPTYTESVKVIIDNNCANSGCHDASGFAPGNFLNYQGLQGVIGNGKFKNRVITQMSMPPAPFKLSAQELELIKCWAETGFALE
jgi:hypothetical protein